MRFHPAIVISSVFGLSIFTAVFAQKPPAPERPAQFPQRGTRGAIAAGSGYATDAAMRMYYTGGNAVDAGVASIFAAATTEYSHVGWGGEAPILIRTKDGKVHAIAGVGTMPKLATADFYRKRPLQVGEILEPPEKTGLKGMVPVAGIMAALVPSLPEASLVALRDYGTKSFHEAVAPAIEFADGSAIDEQRAGSIQSSREFFTLWPTSAKHFMPDGHLPSARSGSLPSRHGRGGEKSSRRRSEPRRCHRCRARLFLSRRDREKN
jgi:gamma-glutamyltranspeptidase / glutathione hydrolase